MDNGRSVVFLRISFTLFILFSISTQSIIGSSAIGTTLVVFSVFALIIIIVIYSIRKTNSQIYLNNPPAIILVSMFIIMFLYFMHILHGNFQENSNVLSSIISMFLFFFCILIVPAYVTIDEYLKVLAYLSFSLVLLSFPSLLFGYGSDRLLWEGSRLVVPVIELEIHRIDSVTTNPNVLGRILFPGLIASIALATRYKKSIYLIQTMIVFSGLILTESRASLIAAVIGLSIYLVGIRFKRNYLFNSTIVILSLVVVINIYVLFGGISSNLSGRVELWRASVNAIISNPLGYGLGYSGDFIEPYVLSERYSGDAPHNSYLRVGVELGIIGMISYIVIMVETILRGIHTDPKKIAILAIATGFLFNQSFESHTLFGTTAPSVINAITVGYLLTTLDNEENE